jgi:hypothetical protein
MGEPRFPQEEQMYMPPELCRFLGVPPDSVAVAGDIVARAVGYAMERELYLEAGNIDDEMAIAFNVSPEDRRAAERFVPEARANGLLCDEPFFPDGLVGDFLKQFWEELNYRRLMQYKEAVAEAGATAPATADPLNDFVMDLVRYFGVAVFEGRRMAESAAKMPFGALLQYTDILAALAGAMRMYPELFHEDDATRVRGLGDRMNQYRQDGYVYEYYNGDDREMIIAALGELNGEQPPHEIARDEYNRLGDEEENEYVY